MTTVRRRQDRADNNADRAIEDLLKLVAIVRERDQVRVDEMLEELDRQRLYGMAVAAACLIRPDVPVVQDLAWINTDPDDWPDEVVTAESDRFAAGDRDQTAWMGRREATIRANRRTAAALKPLAEAHATA